MSNYFEVHKNKFPKKAKYSKPYTKSQLEKIEICSQYFIEEISKIKQNFMVIVLIIGKPVEVAGIL